MGIYFDNAPTTFIDNDVLDVMLPYLTKKCGNPNSIHSFGREAAAAVARAREDIAGVLNAKADEIYFTAGGTEADNWAIKGVAYANRENGNHIITTQVEHHAVLEACAFLKKQGYKITYLPVDKSGRVNVRDIEKAITAKTILISVMAANNEIGTLMPVEEIGKLAKERKIYFHSDCVQAAGAIDLNVIKMNVDIISLSAHKFYGPKGAGALYIRNGVKIDSLIHGGNQERARRGGTTNTAAVVGMAKALTNAFDDREKNNKKILAMREYFIDKVQASIDNVYLNGDRQGRLPNNINFSFEFIEGEALLYSLDLDGIAASSGSACSAGSLEPSHVLLATGIPIELARSSVRFTLGKHNTYKEIDKTVDRLKVIVARLRRMSPLFLEVKTQDYKV